MSDAREYAVPTPSAKGANMLLIRKKFVGLTSRDLFNKIASATFLVSRTEYLGNEKELADELSYDEFP